MQNRPMRNRWPGSFLYLLGWVALAAAGAGAIGDYDSWTFSSPGEAPSIGA